VDVRQRNDSRAGCTCVRVCLASDIQARAADRPQASGLVFLTREGCAATAKDAHERRRGQRLMLRNCSTPMTCRDANDRKERCVPAKAPEEQLRPVAVVVLGAGMDNFRDNLGDSRVAVTRSLSYT
jgi:hypothetical protein